jgi:hypothetical protein
MSNVEKILALTRNKTKRVNLCFNKQLFSMFSEESGKEGKKSVQKIEEFMLKYLEEKGRIQ